MILKSSTESEMPVPDGDSSSSDSEISDDSDTDTQTTWRPDVQYSNPTPDDRSNIILKFAPDSDTSSDESDCDDSQEFEDGKFGSKANTNRFADYVAEKILEHKVHNGKMFYFVRWLDFPPKHDTWQSEKSFPPGFVMLQEYNVKHKLT